MIKNNNNEPTLFPLTYNRKELCLEIFQRTSIGVRVATSHFCDHSEQVVSISYTSENPTPFPFVVLTSILTSFKSRWSKKFLFRYSELFTSHLSKSSERFLLFIYQKANTINILVSAIYTNTLLDFFKYILAYIVDML